MNTLTIDIRKAEPRDAVAIADVHQLAWQGAYAGIIPHKALMAMINRRGPDWWANAIRRAATVLVIEIAPVVFLLTLTLALSVRGGPVMQYMDATARSLHTPESYVQGVLSAAPRASPATETAR